MTNYTYMYVGDELTVGFYRIKSIYIVQLCVQEKCHIFLQT